MSKAALRPKYESQELSPEASDLLSALKELHPDDLLAIFSHGMKESEVSESTLAIAPRIKAFLAKVEGASDANINDVDQSNADGCLKEFLEILTEAAKSDFFSDVLESQGEGSESYQARVASFTAYVQGRFASTGENASTRRALFRSVSELLLSCHELGADEFVVGFPPEREAFLCFRGLVERFSGFKRPTEPLLQILNAAHEIAFAGSYGECKEGISSIQQVHISPYLRDLFSGKINNGDAISFEIIKSNLRKALETHPQIFHDRALSSVAEDMARDYEDEVTKLIHRVIGSIEAGDDLDDSDKDRYQEIADAKDRLNHKAAAESLKESLNSDGCVSVEGNGGCNMKFFHARERFDKLMKQALKEFQVTLPENLLYFNDIAGGGEGSEEIKSVIDLDGISKAVEAERVSSMAAFLQLTVSNLKKSISDDADASLEGGGGAAEDQTSLAEERVKSGRRRSLRSRASVVGTKGGGSAAEDQSPLAEVNKAATKDLLDRLRSPELLKRRDALRELNVNLKTSVGNLSLYAFDPEVVQVVLELQKKSLSDVAPFEKGGLAIAYDKAVLKFYVEKWNAVKDLPDFKECQEYLKTGNVPESKRSSVLPFLLLNSSPEYVKWYLDKNPSHIHFLLMNYPGGLKFGEGISLYKKTDLWRSILARDDFNDLFERLSNSTQGYGAQSNKVFIGLFALLATARGVNPGRVVEKLPVLNDLFERKFSALLLDVDNIEHLNKGLIHYLSVGNGPPIAKDDVAIKVISKLCNSRVIDDAARLQLSYYASRSGHVEVVRALLDMKAFDFGLTLDYAESPLMAAIRCGHVEIVTELLNRGTRLDGVGKDGKTALSLAVIRGGDKGEQMINLLLGRGDDFKELMDDKDHRKFFLVALMSLMKKQRAEISDSLIKVLHILWGKEKKYETEKVLDRHVFLIALTSVLFGHVEMIKKALPKRRAYLSKGELPNARCFNIHVEAKSGDPLLTLAIRHGQVEAVKALLDGGADLSFVNEKTKEDALITAVSSERIASIEDRKEICKILLERGASPLLRDSHGKTASEIAAKKGYLDLSKVLKAKEAEFTKAASESLNGGEADQEEVVAACTIVKKDGGGGKSKANSKANSKVKEGGESSAELARLHPAKRRKVGSNNGGAVGVKSQTELKASTDKERKNGDGPGGGRNAAGKRRADTGDENGGGAADSPPSRTTRASSSKKMKGKEKEEEEGKGRRGY